MSDLPPHYQRSAPDVVNVDLDSLLKSGKLPSKNILEKLPIKEFVEGAYTYPHDWWNGINLIMGLSGRYGRVAQQKANIYMRQILNILDASLQGMPYTTKVVFVVLKYLMFDELTRCTAVNVALEGFKSKKARNELASFAASAVGRKSVGMFTKYAQTGGRAGRRMRKNKRVIAGLTVSNLFLVTLGSLTRLVIRQKKSSNGN